MKRIGLFLMLALLAGLAIAASPVTKQPGRWAFMGGVSVGIDNDANRITKSLGGSGTIDFATQTITCNTSNITVTGAKTGDACFVGPPSSGGAANSSFTCYVSAANTVTVKHCPAGTASDPASATYYVRVFSSQ